MNSIVRLQQPGPNVPAPGTRQGDWVWDGNQWMCSPCSSGDAPPFPCPPPGWPPPGCPPWFSGMNSPPWYPGANAGVSFGTTAPSNPVRGHFWWNGITLYMFDGAAWVNTTGGGVTPPSTSPPANPSPGQQWFNGSQLFVWDGNAWVPVSQTKTYLQATAPPAPNAGDLWYDGSVMRIWDGSTWQLVGPGSIGPVPTSTVVISVVQTGYFAAPAAWGVVNLTTTPQIDTEAGWDPNTKKYTPKKAGNYMFQCTVWEASGGGIALVKNDTGSFVNDQNNPSLGIDTSGAAGYLQLTCITHMNGTSDFVRLFGWSAASQFWGNPTPAILSGLILA